MYAFGVTTANGLRKSRRRDLLDAAVGIADQVVKPLGQVDRRKPGELDAHLVRPGDAMRPDASAPLLSRQEDCARELGAANRGTAHHQVDGLLRPVATTDDSEAKPPTACARSNLDTEPANLLTRSIELELQPFRAQDLEDLACVHVEANTLD